MKVLTLGIITAKCI